MCGQIDNKIDLEIRPLEQVIIVPTSVNLTDRDEIQFNIKLKTQRRPVSVVFCIKFLCEKQFRLTKVILILTLCTRTYFQDSCESICIFFFS